MMLFLPEHVPMILQQPGYPPKTQTRRLWKTQRAREGSIQKFYSGGMPFSKCRMCDGTRWDGTMPCSTCHGTGLLQPFCSARILRVWREWIYDMTPEEIAAEGYPGWSHGQFMNLWDKLYRQHPYGARPWAIEFEVVK